jgi:hypothetical protein
MRCTTCLLVGAAFALVAGAAVARSSVPVINHDNIVIAPFQNPVTPEVARRTIVNAGLKRKYPWAVVAEAPGKLKLQSNVRGKHTLVVDVAYDAKAFSIKYADSTNMSYEVQDGVPVIHPNYNKWVQQLMHAISVDFSRH